MHDSEILVNPSPTLAQFSFRHAPVSKSIFFASAAATLACFSSKTIADFFDVYNPPFFRHLHRLFVLFQAKPSPTLLIAFSKHVLRLLPFRGVSDALFGLYMLYWFRCFERMMGPRKFVELKSHVKCIHLLSHSPSSHDCARYFSLAAASALLSATLQSVLSSLFDVRLLESRRFLRLSSHRHCRLASGPYSLLYFGLVLYYR